MNIELSSHELNLLHDALKAWEKEETTVAFGASMMSLMLVPKSMSKEEMTYESIRIIEKAEAGLKKREAQSILLRAKLLQAALWAKEYEVKKAESYA